MDAPPLDSTFTCNICRSHAVSHRIERSDGHLVVFCRECGMGVIEDPPESTDAYYADGYYNRGADDAPGYADYEFTAEHVFLWVKVFLPHVIADDDWILDVGCANGRMLDGLGVGPERYGIEVNAAAAAIAASRGMKIIGRDIAQRSIIERYARSFDVVTSIATFEHVLDFRGAVETCLLLLKPSGFLLFEVPLISDTHDNAEWFTSSLEHIHYPTVSGMERLARELPTYGLFGFECESEGHSSSYIGVAASEPSVLARVRELLEIARRPGLDGLGDAEVQLNLAYHVVHRSRPTPERVLALPTLLEEFASPGLLKRLTQLWYADAVKAANLEWQEQQARNWQEAFEWQEQQTRNWQEAFENLRIATGQ